MSDGPSVPAATLDWFHALYEEHHPAVLAYARRRVPEPDDVVAEVFSTAWRARDRVPDLPLPWLLRVAHHEVQHQLRAVARSSRLSLRVREVYQVAYDDHADDVAARLDSRQIVLAALSRLSPHDQEILRLTAWEQLNLDDIAYVIKCSPGAARVRLHRARKRLTAALAELEPRYLHQVNRIAVSCEVQP